MALQSSKYLRQIVDFLIQYIYQYNLRSPTHDFIRISRTPIPIMLIRISLQNIFSRHVSNSLRHSHDVQHAEDMVAEAYIRVAKNINRIAEIPTDKHRSYLKMIIRNICIDYYRSIHPTDTVYEIPLDLSDNSSGPEDIIVDRITVEAIAQAISELPDKYRDVLKLSYLYDHTTEEIGIALNLSTNTVHKRISRAKKLLKVILTKEGVLQ